MKFTIEPGTSADIDELEKLYDELNDYRNHPKLAY